MQQQNARVDGVRSPPPAGSRPLIVLLVDDDADTLEMYEALLISAGFRVVHASAAREAFEYARDLHPDALVTDLLLPGPMTGADLIREIRADAALRDLPILAITGVEPKQVPSLAGLHMSALLLKPVAPVTLVSRLKAAIADAAAARAHDADRLAADAFDARGKGGSLRSP